MEHEVSTSCSGARKSFVIGKVIQSVTLLQVSLIVRYKMYHFITNITKVFVHIFKKSFGKFMTEFSYNILYEIIIYIHTHTYIRGLEL